MSLLRSLVADVESSVVPYHTIVEVYRVAPHMPLMRVLPSAVDEVNAALFHPCKVSLRPTLLSPLAAVYGCQPLGWAVGMHVTSQLSCVLSEP